MSKSSALCSRVWSQDKIDTGQVGLLTLELPHKLISGQRRADLHACHLPPPDLDLRTQTAPELSFAVPMSPRGRFPRHQITLMPLQLRSDLYIQIELLIETPLSTSQFIFFDWGTLHETVSRYFISHLNKFIRKVYNTSYASICCFIFCEFK